MLRQPDGLALHHLKAHVKFKNHSHQRRFGQNFTDPVCDHGIIAPFHDLRPKSRTVHTVNADDPVLYPGLAVHCAVHRQISSFGVASHVKRLAQTPRHPIQISHAVLLPRHGRQKGHVEVFLPAYYGLVRPTVSHIYGAVVQNIGYS